MTISISKKCLIDFAIDQGFEYVAIKTARFCQTYKCATKGCQWRIHASKSLCGHYLMVKSSNYQHKCQLVKANRKASSNWMARVLANDLRVDPNMKLGVMKQKLKNRFALTGIAKAKLFKARVKAKGGTMESHTEEFCNLRCYAHMIMHTNPISVAVIYSDTSNHPPNFKRIFICLVACIHGFLEGFQPVIGLDGYHFKGPYGGVLLGAISMDANLQFFLIAYAIVEIEDSSS